jgi:hypothetical protein
MDSSYAVKFVPTEVHECQRCNWLFQNASAELGAYIAAVEQRFGHQAAERAGKYWVDLLERSGAPNSDARSEFRRITILAASHLADVIT